MKGKIDLHIHSNKSSDGDLSVKEIIESASGRLSAISITDHDTLDAYPEAIELGNKNNVEVIQSIEITTHFNGKELHLLTPFIEKKGPILELLEKLKNGRMLLAEERIKRLRELGFSISMEDVISYSPGTIPIGTAIARVLFESQPDHPALRDYLKEPAKAPYRFYKDYFEHGGLAYVPFNYVFIEEAINVARKSGGVPVLAHPGASFCKISKEELIYLKEKGLEGVEVWTSYHDLEKKAFYLSLAKELELIPTPGSDFHGRIKPNVAFASVEEGNYSILEMLKDKKEKNGRRFSMG
ncbi:MAG: PHP domain-containing protein [Candidatus Aminicenantia bacterium]